MLHVLDGKFISSKRDMLAYLHTELFPQWEHFGMNLDAAYDVLTTDVARPITIEWRNATTSYKAMGADEFAQLVSLLADVAAFDRDLDFNDKFEFRLA